MHRMSAGVIIALALGAMGPARAWTLLQSQPQPTVGKPAPKFTATLFSGGKVSLEDYKGQVLLVNVWATWCGPCRQELPTLDAYNRVAGKWGLRIIAVTTENSVPDRLLKPLSEHLSFPLAHEVRGPYGDLGAVPTSYVIDRAGVVRYAEADAFDLDKLNAVLIPLLKEPAPADPAPVFTAPVSTASVAPPTPAAASAAALH